MYDPGVPLTHVFSSRLSNNMIPSLRLAQAGPLETKMTTTATAAGSIFIGGARADLTDVRLRPDIVLDEVHIEGGDISVDPATGDAEPRVTSGETRVRAVMSEANLNRLVTVNLPAD